MQGSRLLANGRDGHKDLNGVIFSSDCKCDLISSTDNFQGIFFNTDLKKYKNMI